MAYDEMKSDGFKKLKPTYEGDTKQAHKADPREDERWFDDESGEWTTRPESKEAKKDAPSTTSSEGSANFVYSDVKEAEKQKQ